MNVLFPISLAEGCELQSRHAGALVPIAGATDLLVHWPIRQAERDRTYLDLSGVRELRHVTWSASHLTLGAMATYWDVLRDERAAKEFPLLIDAARQVGAVQIQSRGTWAGNIANASPAADGVPALMAYEATIVLVSTSGSREVPLSDYYLGYKKSVRRPDELIGAVSIARRAHDFGVFHKVGPRRAQAITKVGLAIARRGNESSDAWRVVANSVAPTVRRCRAVEQALNNGTVIRSPDDFMTAVGADVSPIDDIRSTAEYRRTVMCRLLYYSLRGVCPSVE